MSSRGQSRAGGAKASAASAAHGRGHYGGLSHARSNRQIGHRGPRTPSFTHDTVYQSEIKAAEDAYKAASRFSNERAREQARSRYNAAVNRAEKAASARAAAKNAAANKKALAQAAANKQKTHGTDAVGAKAAAASKGTTSSTAKSTSQAAKTTSEAKKVKEAQPTEDIGFKAKPEVVGVKPDATEEEKASVTAGGEKDMSGQITGDTQIGKDINKVPQSYKDIISGEKEGILNNTATTLGQRPMEGFDKYGNFSSGTLGAMLSGQKQEDLANKAWDKGEYGSWLGHKLHQVGIGMDEGVRENVDDLANAPLDKVSDIARKPITTAVVGALTGGVGVLGLAGLEMADTVTDVVQGEKTLKEGLVQGLHDMKYVSPTLGMVGNFLDDPYGTTAGELASHMTTGNIIGDMALDIGTAFVASKIKDAVEGTGSLNGGSNAVQSSLNTMRGNEHGREIQKYQEGHRKTPPLIDPLYQQVDQHPQQDFNMPTGSLRPDVLLALSQAQQDLNQPGIQPLQLGLA